MTLHIAIVGSGPSGMTAAMLLARQGHRITLIDRDPGPVPGRTWDRVGVMQFHLPHSLRAPGRQLLADRLPDVHDALLAAGAEVRVLSPGVPETMAGMHVRRSVLERTIWECTTREPGVHRLTGHVDEIVVVGHRARGVVVDGSFVPADLVVDASGRAARLGAEHRPASEGEPAGIAYASRMYQLRPGAAPGETNGGPGLIKVHDGFMQLVFLHDQGTFSILLVRAVDDAELAELRHEDAFETALSVLPESSVWTDPGRSRPIGPVRAGSGLVNTYRGQPRDVHGLLSIGDAVLTTNPAGARGLSLGMRAAAALVDIVADLSSEQWAAALDDWGCAELRPWFEEHLMADAWLRDHWAGAPLDPEAPVPWNLVMDAAVQHPEWMRFLGPFLGMAAGPAVLDPLREQVRAMLRDGWRPAPPAGITRDELVAAIQGTRVAA
jgi:2-polyprenyl-6-methoxyphenol hydroxylase-like FAD-dependent oxidoreductase